VNEPEYFIGLISGTSRDGVDAALVRFEGERTSRPELLDALCLPYPSNLGRQLAKLLQTGQRPHRRSMAELDPLLAEHFAAAALHLLERTGLAPQAIHAIGSHGQTVWHEPDARPPETVQLGDPHAIAGLTGITTVGDFRQADLVAGGQGAPLAPLLHRALFQPEHGRRVVLNLGGIANISVLDADGRVAGHDTGPANCLLDAWSMKQRGLAFDQSGDWAASGRVEADLLAAALADPYFRAPAPKSTGVEYFNLRWLSRLRPLGRIEPADVQATLAELTAASVAEAIRASEAADVLVCGGGVHNRDLLRRLRARLPGLPLRSTAEAGLDPDWVEAVLFAWLARERLQNRAQDTRAITGARQPVLLGVVAEPPGLK